MRFEIFPKKSSAAGKSGWATSCFGNIKSWRALCKAEYSPVASDWWVWFCTPAASRLKYLKKICELCTRKKKRHSIYNTLEQSVISLSADQIHKHAHAYSPWLNIKYFWVQGRIKAILVTFHFYSKFQEAWEDKMHLNGSQASDATQTLISLTWLLSCQSKLLKCETCFQTSILPQSRSLCYCMASKMCSSVLLLGFMSITTLLVYLDQSPPNHLQQQMFRAQSCMLHRLLYQPVKAKRAPTARN